MSPGREVRRRLRGLEPRPGSGFARIIGRVIGDNRTVELRDLLDEFSEIGGDLLAAALALRALVGFLVLLLLLSIGLGILSDDPTLRAAMVVRAADLVPGLDAPVTAMLHDLSSGRATYSILALVGLAWTTGGVYGTLDDALRRVFPGGRPRGMLERRVRGLLAVVLIFGSVAVLLALSAVWSALEANLLPGDGTVWRVVSPVGGAAMATLVILVVYRLVPTAPPTLREAGPPAVVAGVTVAAMTATYALIAPRLVGALSVFGAVAVVIGTLLWLAWVFRVILMAGLWASRRRDDQSLALDGLPP
ncbi:MAG: YhjD/YihY/BrkB family envelope integrity protein [Candidatus Limnocylindrales bacterium]|jgi:uncharacterized BrkB/YihY/UPF0761 family membrane protein